MRVAALLAAWVCPALGFDLLVLHTNDMHARLDEVSRAGGTCFPKFGCYGGFARLKAAVDSIRMAESNVVFLNAGDTFQGTPYYNVFKWKIIAKFVDMLGIDVMSLGNHEFDDGVGDATEYLKTVKTPSVCCNIDTGPEPAFLGANLHPYYNLTVGGVHIAVVGYLTPDTKFLARTGNVTLTEEVSSVRKTAREARMKGARLVIAVGHSGFETDRRIAREVEEVDLVVGGHTNTFLYSGQAPDSEVPASTYPHMEAQASGRKVPVVQAFAYTKYLGYLKLKFDDNFNLISYKGNPILLNKSMPKDANVTMELKTYEKSLEARTKEVVGQTNVQLDGSCRQKECNLGNMVSDAFVDHAVHDSYDHGWTSAPIGIVNGGTIRSSVEVDRNNNNNTLLMGQLMTILPFENPLLILSLNGSVLKEVLETSVYNYDVSGVLSNGGFLQMSGMKVEYNMKMPPGSRVESVTVRCGDCSIPKYFPLVQHQEYRLVTNTYIAEGGDNFTALRDKARIYKHLDNTDTQIIYEYIKKGSPVHPGEEERINFIYSNLDKTSSASLTYSRPSIFFCVCSLYIILLKLG